MAKEMIDLIHVTLGLEFEQLNFILCKNSVLTKVFFTPLI